MSSCLANLALTLVPQVICSEGNAGFPEVGCPLLPLRIGYSVIGWNHPGFAGSTGLPYPENEQDAMESVVQFALQRLRFRQENILLYGWSIGGYTISWAAMNYPQVRSVVSVTVCSLWPFLTTGKLEMFDDCLLEV